MKCLLVAQSKLILVSSCKKSRIIIKLVVYPNCYMLVEGNNLIGDKIHLIQHFKIHNFIFYYQCSLEDCLSISNFGIWNSVFLLSSSIPIFDIPFQFGLLGLVWFVTDATQLLCQDLLRSRKLCQSPYSQVTAVTAESFRQPVLDVFLTPQYANWLTSCRLYCAGHGVGTWSAERHWEADPTTAGRGYF